MVINPSEERLVIICDCHDVEHQVQFVYDPEEFDEGYDVVYMHTHLVKNSFFDRLKYGIKYIFGYRSRYGAFNEMVLRPESVDRIIKHLTEFRNRKSN